MGSGYGSVAGVRVDEWIEMFFSVRTITSIGILGDGWPDGNSFLEQEDIVIKVFGVLREVTVEFLKRE